MRSVFSRLFLILAVLMIAASVLPAFADEEAAEPAAAEPAAEPSVESAPAPAPWWEVCPPAPPKPKTRTRVVYRQAETMIESKPAEGWCYTAITRVNVRSQPSTRATRVMTIRSVGTEFNVTARVKNSAGEIWYAVQLANGTLGYIRSDLVNTDHVILLEDPYTYEAEVNTRPAAASESASSVINIITTPEPTPQVIYVTVNPQPQATPTPIIVYVTPEPDLSQPQPTPQIVYATLEPVG